MDSDLFLEKLQPNYLKQFPMLLARRQFGVCYRST